MQRRRDDGGGLRTRPARSPATSSSASLKVFYDDNKVSIDGPTSLSFSEDVGKRFEAYGWRVLRVEDGNDLDALDAAIQAAEAESERPTLVIVRTIIGYGSPNRQGTSKAHGEALGPEETAATKKNLGWPLEPTFLVPDEAQGPVRRGRASAARSWSGSGTSCSQRYREAHPDIAAELDQRLSGKLPDGWEDAIPTFDPKRQADRHPRRLRQGAQRDRPQAAAARGRLGGPDARRTTPPSRGAATSRPPTPRGSTSASASASTAWERS